MRETPRSYGRAYLAEPLAPFRWHTGRTPSPLGVDEPCPVLFRDVGLTATLRFLERGLERLAGPYTPLTYLRTAEYREPYTDHEATGRLVVLRPLALHVWRSGVPHVFIASARRTPAPAELAWVPGDVPLAAAEALLADVRTSGEAREVFGARRFDALVADTRARLTLVERERITSEALAEPLRRALSAPDTAARARAREALHSSGLGEEELCAAFHHLPRERRALLLAALPRLAGTT